MNNSFIVERAAEVPKEHLHSIEGELVKIIEAVKEIESTNAWSTLKALVFDQVTDNLEKRLRLEANRPELNAPDMYRLQGQLVWARRYSNLDTLLEAKRLELTNVRRQLNPPTERDIAPDTYAD